MSRCQPLGLSSAATRPAVSSWSSRGIGRGFLSAGYTRQIRPRSCPSRRSSVFSRSSLIHCGCSITKRYMSTTHSAPSGPVRIVAGRNQGSCEPRNSDCCSSAARSPRNKHAVGRDDLAADAVVDRVGEEGIAGEFRPQQFIAVDHRAAQAGPRCRAGPSGGQGSPSAWCVTTQPHGYDVRSGVRSTRPGGAATCGLRRTYRSSTA